MNITVRESVMVVLTIARLLLVWGLVVSYSGSPWVTMAWLAVIVVVDIYDGKLARRFNADGVARRAADVVVDYVSIAWALIAMLVAKPQYLDWYVLLNVGVALVSKVVYFATGYKAYKNCRVILRGAGLHHKLVPFAAVALCVAMVWDAELQMVYSLTWLFGFMCLLTGQSYLLTYRRVIQYRYANNTKTKVIYVTGLPAYDHRNPDLVTQPRPPL